MPETPFRDHVSFGECARVRIRVQGGVPETWHDRLGGLSVATTWEADQDPVTVLTGRVADQAALMGVLGTLHDLHLPLISVDLLETGMTDEEPAADEQNQGEGR